MKKLSRPHSHARRSLRRTLVAAACAAACVLPSMAVVPMPELILSPQATGYLARARQMLSDANFAGTEDQIRMLMPDYGSLSDVQMQECRYLLAKAIYERGGEECVSILRAFVSDYPASPYALQARLTIADYYFFAGKFGQALQEYSTIDIPGLPSSDRLLYTYRKALSMVKTGYSTESRPLFRSLQSNALYAPAAEFYLAYADYAEGDYDRAYDGFMKAREMTARAQVSRKGFEPTGLDADYYIDQILFKRGDYAQARRLAREILASNPGEEYAPEINRIAGESAFKLGNSDEARSYLLRYLEASAEPAPSAVYALGVIDYDNGDYGQAAERFSSITDQNSEIGQSAWLYLGQCGVKQHDDSAAAMAFEKAYKLNFDRKVTETALYNYVAARGRGGNIPFASSVDMLEDFLRTFPNSEYAPAVQEYLATAYYNDHDYKRALTSIERIKRPSAKVLAAKQKILYELGIEALSNGRAKDASSYMSRAISTSSSDKALIAQANLWLGDALYAQGEYRQARQAYENFIKSGPRTQNYALGLYGLAYSLYQQDNFRAAATRFNEAMQASPSLPSNLKADAAICYADCQYYTGNISQARQAYERAMSLPDADMTYAAYRRAIMAGLGGDTQGKLRELDALIRNYSSSRWIPTAMLEKGITLTTLGKHAQAEETFESLAQSYPSSAESRKGMLRLAISCASSGKGEKAEQVYREVISRWPTSEEAGIANEDLRLIYARKGELQQYQAFLSSIEGAPRMDDSDVERLTYDVAANEFAKSADNTAKLQAYVNQYPSGRYVAQALLDLASAAYEKQDYDRAYNYAEQLLVSRPDAGQVPEALLIKAEILEQQRGDKAAAALAYQELERRGGADFAGDAAAGLMRTTTDPVRRLAYARRVKQAGGLTPEQTEEASYYEAQGLAASGDNRGAEIIYRQLCANSKSLYGAKSTVALGEALLQQGRNAEAEKLLSDFAEQGTPHHYELARGYIALADALTAQGKKYLAVEYLRSLKDNYPGSEEDIRQMINQRLNSWK